MNTESRSCACGCGRTFISDNPRRIYFDRKECRHRAALQSRRAAKRHLFQSPDPGAPAAEFLYLSPLPLRHDQKTNLRAMVEMGKARSLPDLMIRLIDQAIIAEIPVPFDYLPLVRTPDSPTKEQWMYHYATVTPHEALEALRETWGLAHYAETIERALLTVLGWLQNSPDYLAKVRAIRKTIMGPQEPQPTKIRCMDEGVDPVTLLERKRCGRTARFYSPNGNVWCDHHYGPGDRLL